MMIILEIEREHLELLQRISELWQDWEKKLRRLSCLGSQISIQITLIDYNPELYKRKNKY